MSYKLFALLIGCRPQGRNTEQHDMFFKIAESLADVIPALNKFWEEAEGKIHIDAWREVNNVDGFDIKILPRDKSIQQLASRTLFFINLGGYKPGEFEEYHYKILTVAENKSDAITQSKQTAFYQHTGFKGAESHIDDKYGIDADDIHAIADILPAEVKEKFSIEISKAVNGIDDELHMGYLPFSKMR